MPGEDNAKELLKQKLSDDTHVSDELDLFKVQVDAESRAQPTDINAFAKEVMHENGVVSVEQGVQDFVDLQECEQGNLKVSEIREGTDEKMKSALELTTIGVAMQLIGPVLFAELTDTYPNWETEGFTVAQVQQTLGSVDIGNIALLRSQLDKHHIPLTQPMQNLLGILGENTQTHHRLVWDYILQEYPATVNVMKESMVSLTTAYTKELGAGTHPTDERSGSEHLGDNHTPADIIVLPDLSAKATRNASALPADAVGGWGMPLASKGAAANRTTVGDLRGNSGGWGFAGGALPDAPASSGPDAGSEKWPAWKTYAAAAAVIVGSTAVSAGIRNWIRGASPPDGNGAGNTPPNAPAAGNTPAGQQSFFGRRWPWLLGAGVVGGGALYYFNKKKDGSSTSASVPAGVDPASVVVSSGSPEIAGASVTATPALAGAIPAGADPTGVSAEDIPVAVAVSASTVSKEPAGSAGKKSTDKAGRTGKETADKVDTKFLEGKHESVAAMYTRLSTEFGYDPSHQAVIVDTIAQKLYVVKNKTLKEYDISTADNRTADGSVKTHAPEGISSKSGSNGMPAGVLKVSGKVGEGLPAKTVLKPTTKDAEHHQLHGESTESADATNTNQMTSRILYMEGQEPSTQEARKRGIYIHGTPQEQLIGEPSSHGCIRMKNADIIELCDALEEGTLVGITNPEDYGYKLVDDRGDGKRGYKKSTPKK